MRMKLLLSLCVSFFLIVSYEANPYEANKMWELYSTPREGEGCCSLDYMQCVLISALSTVCRTCTLLECVLLLFTLGFCVCGYKCGTDSAFSSSSGANSGSIQNYFRIGHNHLLATLYAVTCRGLRVTIWRVLVRMIGFINTLITTSLNYTQLQRYRWFTHNSYFTVTRTSPLLVMDLHTETVTSNHYIFITHEIFQSHFASTQADLLYSVRVLLS
jgi:hypothetical protein